MDSYGIHQAQLQGNSMAGYVQNYNDTVRAHKQGALSTYNKAKKDGQTSKDILDAHLGGATAIDGLSGVHAGYQFYKSKQLYGGVGNAIVNGTNANLHAMTGGKLGMIAMGPNESLARGVTPANVDLGAPFKKAGNVLQSGAQSLGDMAKKVVSGGAPETGVFQLQGAGGEVGIPKGATGSAPTGPPASVSGGDVEKGQAEVEKGQAEDRAMGVGWEKEGAQSDPSKSLTQIGEDAKVGESDAGLSLQGKVLKAGLKKAGVNQGVAHSLGAVSGAVVSGAMGIDSAVDDFGDGGKKWKSDDGLQKAGQVFDFASDAVGVVDTFVPELAPLGAILGGVGAVMDMIGGDQAESKKKSQAQSTYKNASSESYTSAPDVKGTVATTTGPTSLQKVSGQSSSY